MRLGKLDEGQQLLERALVIRQKALGPEHPFVATTGVCQRGRIARTLVGDQDEGVWPGARERRQFPG